MKRIIVCFTVILLTVNVFAQTFAEWQQRANQGDVKAMHQIGRFYYLGDSVKQNYKEAVQWYTIAADKGYPNSQNNLAICYLSGNGVSVNIEKAMQLLHLAAAKNLPNAMHILANVFGDKDNVVYNPDSCFYWDKRAADLDFTISQYRLSLYYEHGFGTESNEQQALVWALQAAQKGYAEAEEQVVHLYMDGRDIEKDDEALLYWLQQAASHGRLFCVTYLGICYQQGTLTLPIDKTKAFELFKQAAEQEYAWGQYELANCYRYGRGCLQDKALALYWYEQAAIQGFETAVQALQEINMGINPIELRYKNEQYRQWFETHNKD
ncbi:MAG: tetratricopeptide repeat protein [Paludibacteraceae bacterium]